MVTLSSAIIGSSAVLLALCGGVGVASAAQSGRGKRIRQQMLRITEGRPDSIDAEGFGATITAFGRRALRGTREYEDLSKLLQSAGLFSPLAPFRVFALQLILMLVCPLVSAAVVGAFSDTFESFLVTIVAGVPVGYLGPRNALRIVAAGRQQRIRRELPFFIDTMLMLLRSGLGLERCLREIAQLGGEAMPEIVRSVDFLIVDIEQGHSYNEALDRWAERLAIPAADEIAGQLQQSLNHGTELSKALGIFTRRLIAQQLASARERAGHRTTHVTAVTMVFFLPPLLVLLAAPGFTQIIRALGHH